MSAPDAPGADPLEVFARWHAEADAPDADDLALATATPDGRPSVRLVLLRGLTPEGVRFYTNYGSRKGRELEANPAVAAVWFDRVRRRQVRLEGHARRLAAVDSDAYFAARPRGHQLSAVASRQSTPIASRDELERAVEAAERRFAHHEVERPEGWGGYELVADAVELWLQRDDRLHDRFAYRREPGGWQVERLSP